MNPTTGKLVASAFFSSSQSATRSVSPFKRYSLLERMVVSLAARDQAMKHFSSAPKITDASLGSSRGRQAVDYLPSYLVDARSVETYDAKTSPNGALQLRSVL